MSGHNTLTFVDEVERFFLRLRGHGLMLSPAERVLAEVWATRGAPLGVVCMGIEKAMLSFRSSHEPDAPPPKLTYCRRSVEAEIRSYRDMLDVSGVEEPSEGPAPEPLSFLDMLLVRLEGAVGEAKDERLRGAYEDLRIELNGLRELPEPQIPGRVAELEASLLDRLFERLDSAEKERVEKRTKALQGGRKAMARTGEALAAARRRAVREILGMTSLSSQPSVRGKHD